jgi:hypothetical protein
MLSVRHANGNETVIDIASYIVSKPADERGQHEWPALRQVTAQVNALICPIWQLKRVSCTWETGSYRYGSRHSIASHTQFLPSHLPTCHVPDILNIPVCQCFFVTVAGAFLSGFIRNSFQHVYNDYFSHCPRNWRSEWKVHPRLRQDGFTWRRGPDHTQEAFVY